MSTAELLADSRVASSSFRSVPDMWHHRVSSTPDGEALIHLDARRGWTSMSWRQAAERVRAVANGLFASGLEREQRCAILAATRVEWILVDMGILCAGGATTTIYPSSTPEECSYILNDCQARFVFCDTDAQVAKLLTERERLPHLQKVFVFDGRSSPDGWVVALPTLEDEGRAFAAANPERYDAVSRSIQPGDLATLIYTSGTTGAPKGVMLTHDSWVYESEAVDALGIISPADKQFLFLPLSHVFAKVMEIIFIRLGVPTVVNGDVDTLVSNLRQTSPTWMAAVPRIFEKAYARIVAQAREAGPVKYAIFKWAVGVGREVSAVRQRRQAPSGLLAVKAALADRLVFSKIKEGFGGRLRFFISGGAPLSPEIAAFFHACDVLILEGYGLTESSAASCVNGLDDFIFGTVGRPLEGTEVRIADDGEILIRGRGVMKGYFGLPEATAEAIGPDGSLYTGDLGVKLDSGHIQITGRKKDLIITAGGKNIAPSHFQELLKARCPYVSQALMHGDKRNFCVALVSIQEEATAKWAKEKGLAFRDYADLASRPEVHALIWAEVERINQQLPSFETVKKIVILPEDLTVENGLLTPTLKVKRQVVEARYKQVLDGLYGAPTPSL